MSEAMDNTEPGQLTKLYELRTALIYIHRRGSNSELRGTMLCRASTSRGCKYRKADPEPRTPSSQSDSRKQEKPGRQSVEDGDGEPNKLSDFLPVPETFPGLESLIQLLAFFCVTLAPGRSHDGRDGGR